MTPAAASSMLHAPPSRGWHVNEQSMSLALYMTRQCFLTGICHGLRPLPPWSVTVSPVT